MTPHGQFRDMLCFSSVFLSFFLRLEFLPTVCVHWFCLLPILSPGETRERLCGLGKCHRSLHRLRGEQRIRGKLQFWMNYPFNIYTLANVKWKFVHKSNYRINMLTWGNIWKGSFFGPCLNRRGKVTLLRWKRSHQQRQCAHSWRTSISQASGCKKHPSGIKPALHVLPNSLFWK